MAITVLGILGLLFSEEINHASIYLDFIAKKSLLDGFTFYVILQREQMVDQDNILAMQLFDMLFSSLYISNKQELFPVVTFQMVHLTLQRSACKESES